MIKLMDRQMIYGYFKSYFVCLASLVSLWVVVDLFTNLDDFTHHHKSFIGVLQHIVAYYGFRLTKIFDQLCEPIVLLAAMFTVAWMQRCNEQYPLLSAGVSTKRIVLPVLLCASFMLIVTMGNQEYVIPAVADHLAFDKDDPGGDKEMSIQGVCYEPNGIHIGGERANRRKQTVTNFECVIPDTLAGNMLVLSAEQAVYVPGTGQGKGGWELTNTKPAGENPIGNGQILEQTDSAGRYFLHTRSVDFDSLTRNPNWYLAGLDGPAVRRTAEAGVGPAGRHGGAVPHAADAADPGPAAGDNGLGGDPARPEPQCHHQRRHVSGVVRRVLRGPVRLQDAGRLRDAAGRPWRPGCRF